MIKENTASTNYKERDCPCEGKVVTVKKKCWLIAVSFILVISMCSCVKLPWISKDKGSAGKVATIDQVSSTEASDNSDQTEIVFPSEDEILQEYQLATEASNWFRVCSLSTDPSDMKDYNGASGYSRVQQFQTLEELKQYLRPLFSEEMIDSLVQNGDYVDIDGALYTRECARGTDIQKGEESYSISQESDTKAVLTVSVEVLGDDFSTVVGSEEYQFYYEYINGDWVFTSFPEIR